MDWTVTDTGEARIVRPVGRIDETNWETFTTLLVDAVRSAPVPTIRIDLSVLDYMSSRGLRALTVARKEAGAAHEIVLAAPNPRMREILAISRYDKIFRIDPA